MNYLIIISFILWLYFLTVFKRAKVDYFYFLWGSVGFFIFLMIFVQPIILEPLTVLVTSATGVIGKLTGWFEAYREYSILFINNYESSAAISLYIDYECSGVIEMMAFVSLLAFFQVYDVIQRIVLSIIGCIVVFFSNVLRIFIICTMIYFGGNDMYYVAHTVVGRIVFYFLSILLYYYVFTHGQIIRQKIGGFGYGKNTGNSIK